MRRIFTQTIVGPTTVPHGMIHQLQATVPHGILHQPQAEIHSSRMVALLLYLHVCTNHAKHAQ